MRPANLDTRRFYRKKYATFLVLVGFIFAVHSLSFYQGVYSVYDDAFITFRYSQNLAKGLGPVYNPGEHVEGYTNFLWMFLLSAGSLIGLPIVELSQILGFLSGLFILFLTNRLGIVFGLSEIASLLPVLLLSLTPSFARYTVSGMETLFFSFLLIAAVSVYLSAPGSLKHILITSLIFVLAALTRPEGCLFASIVIGISLIGLVINHCRTVNAREIFLILIVWMIPWLVVYVPYIFWRYTFYGYLLPNTFYAKVSSINIAVIYRGVSYLVLMIPIVNPHLFMISLPIPFIKWSFQHILLALIITCYVFYLVIIGGDQYAFFGPRMLLPVFPFLFLLGSISLRQITFRLKSKWRKPVTMGFGILLLAITLFFGQNERNAYHKGMQTMTKGWVMAGEWMAEQVSDGEVLAIDAAGIIPFLTGMKTIDMYGLNDEYIAHLPVLEMGSGLPGHEKFSPDYVLDQKPDYISVWIDRTGAPAAAGLDRVKDRFFREYGIRALVLMTSSESIEDRVLEIDKYSPELHDLGYIYGIFMKRK